jgi:hypothetical protein
LGVAVNEGGGRVRKKKLGAEVQGGDGIDVSSDEGRGSISAEGESSNSCVPNSLPEMVLEVVLPCLNSVSNSGQLMPQNIVSEDGRGDQRMNSDLGSLKLLQIQQKVGFCYKNPTAEVVTALDEDEQRDRLKKQEWEQINGHQ